MYVVGCFFACFILVKKLAKGEFTECPNTKTDVGSYCSTKVNRLTLSNYSQSASLCKVIANIWMFGLFFINLAKTVIRSQSS